ncbi:MAG: hypothetical protein JW955_09915 [Sedimentisphaerales bacterium]|nr:hypothetical protein [Sedimentisphaerales bacterium]
MNRREFISACGAALSCAATGSDLIFGAEPGRSDSPGIVWHRHEDSGLFDLVAVDGRSLIDIEEDIGPFDGFCHVIDAGKLGREVLLRRDQPRGECGPFQISLGHHEGFPAIAWPRDVRVHYYDFLSSSEANGHRGGLLSRGGIDLMRRLRAAARSFGTNTALFASDCSMANFCLWGDGFGLTRLPPEAKQLMLRDIDSLVKR